MRRREARTIRPPPPGFDEFVSWLGEVSDRLVLVEGFPLEDVRRAVWLAHDRVRAHLRADLPVGSERTSKGPSRESTLWETVLLEHRWFETSLEELVGLLRVVEQDDHGGHRQALGQYGRILAAALERHRRDERELEQLESSLGAAPLRNAN
jgi:hypothetical protein